MKINGSMTVAMSLLLLVILSLLAVCIQGARNACGRVQAANSIDLGLYSLFSEYDRELLEDYHLFFLDAGYGEDEISEGNLINHTERFIKPVLESGLTKCRIKSCGINGYRLASDANGEAVRNQIVRYMKDSLGNIGIRELKEKMNSAQNIMDQQKAIEDGGIEEEDIEDIEPMEEITERNNPLDIVKSIKENGFLGLVLPVDCTVSDEKQNTAEYLSRRTLQQGTGDFPEMKAKPSAVDKLLIQEYILQTLGFFTEEKQEGSMKLQTEYILGGKNNDRDNLKYVVNRLILLRETANIAYLYTDAQKRGELRTCASALSLLLLIPEGMTLVQAVLAAGWAYVESLSDVKILLSGGQVPLAKSAASWKTQLRNLCVENRGNNSSGLNYREYLYILLSFSREETLVLRSMDMIEQNIRKIEGRQAFSLDSCIDTISMSFLIDGPEGKTWQADRWYTYDM